MSLRKNRHYVHICAHVYMCTSVSDMCTYRDMSCVCLSAKNSHFRKCLVPQIALCQNMCRCRTALAHWSVRFVCVQGVAVCCSLCVFRVLQCVAALAHWGVRWVWIHACVAMRCSVLQWCCSVVQCVWGDSRCVAVWEMSVEFWIYAFSCPLLTAQDARNHALAVHEVVDFRFLVLAGSESTITEIIGYTHSGLPKPCRGFSSDTNQFVDRCL